MILTSRISSTCTSPKIWYHSDVIINYITIFCRNRTRYWLYENRNHLTPTLDWFCFHTAIPSQPLLLIIITCIYSHFQSFIVNLFINQSCDITVILIILSYIISQSFDATWESYRVSLKITLTISIPGSPTVLWFINRGVLCYTHISTYIYINKLISNHQYVHLY